jgi:hypothetical protein
LHTANLQLLLKRQREKFVEVENFQPLQEVWEVEDFQPLQKVGDFRLPMLVF